MADIYGIPYFVLIPVGLFIAFYLYLTRHYGHWKRLGIPEVPPLPLTGSYRFDLYSHQGETEQGWCKKYGKIFGMYEGPVPVLQIADPDVLRDILIKDFHIFSEVRDLQFGDPIADRMLFIQRSDKWRELRTLITPTFSSGKMRLMSKLINDCSDVLAENLKREADSNKEVDLTKFFGAYTIDVVARCAFGVKLDSGNDPNNAFVKASEKLLNSGSWRFLVGMLFPGFAKFVRLSVFEPTVTLFFKNAILEVIKNRKNIKDSKTKDFLQLMLDAEIDDENSKDKKKKLEMDDIVAQCVMFLTVGYFTTMATLSYVAHRLALDSEIQEKLLQEIDKNVEIGKEPDYDVVFGMKYLDAVVQETLRYYSPAPRLERRNTEDYRIKDSGIVIPKNTLIAIPVYVIGHDPEFFPDPEKFDPDRFSPDKKESIHPYANLPFGIGPRACIGMRFAMMEVKMALVNILREIKFKPGANTKSKPVHLATKGIHCPASVYLNLELRKKD